MSVATPTTHGAKPNIIAAAKADTKEEVKERITTIQTAREAAGEKRDFMQNPVASVLPSPRGFQAWCRDLLHLPENKG